MSKEPTIDITLQETGNRGRYEARLAGKDAVGELTYSRQGAATLLADHTGVPDALRGQGVGQALVQRLVNDARKNGLKVVPVCPFVRAMWKRHPEWSGVMVNGDQKPV